jgi:hypothetical protein
MALSPRTIGVTNVDIAVFAAVAGRTPNMLSVQVLNPTGAVVTVDIKDGSGGTIVDSVSVGAYGETVKKWNSKQRLGLLRFTAGNGIYAATRVAVSGGVEIILEAGRV